jgi:hypothetical protein
MRPDNPKAMAMHKDRFYGGTALVILGGPSGAGWERLRDAVAPDVIITMNGATRIPGADYWLLTENMNFCESRKDRDERLAAFMHVMDRGNTAETLLVSHRSWNLLPTYGIDESRCVRVMRARYPRLEIDLRNYGKGFLKGPLSRCRGWEPGVRVCVGTVGLQALHLAGILGCAEVHTIGFDLMFSPQRHKGHKDGQLGHEEKHHWYEHPRYEAGRFRTEEMFIEYRGVRTQGWWMETAKYLKSLRDVFERYELIWQDHSEGLLAVEGAWCAQ